ncbi:MAG TPA: hypothetical protein VGM39_15920 [Kofleriaceae bacterium]|jgi:hypothetical protein
MIVGLVSLAACGGAGKGMTTSANAHTRCFDVAATMDDGKADARLMKLTFDGATVIEETTVAKDGGGALTFATRYDAKPDVEVKGTTERAGGWSFTGTFSGAPGAWTAWKTLGKTSGDLPLTEERLVTANGDEITADEKLTLVIEGVGPSVTSEKQVWKVFDCGQFDAHKSALE